MFIYPSKMSISLTYIFLIGGSLASIWKNSTKLNPVTQKTYVNLDIVLITLPVMNSGAMLGVIIFLFRLCSKDSSQILSSWSCLSYCSLLLFTILSRISARTQKRKRRGNGSLRLPAIMWLYLAVRPNLKTIYLRLMPLKAVQSLQMDSNFLSHFSDPRKKWIKLFGFWQCLSDAI